MAHENQATELRPELNAVVEDAMFADEGYIGQELFPYVGYPTRTGEYKRIRLRTGQLLRATDGSATLRAPRSAYPRITGSDEDDNYACVDRGLEEPIDESDKADKSRFYQLEQVALKRVTRTMRLDHEIRVRNRLIDTNVFPTVDPVETYTEANQATIDFIADLKAAKSAMVKMGERPNVVAMADPLWDRISLSKKLATRILGSNASDKVLSPSMVEAFLSEMLRMPIRLLVGQAAYEATKKARGKTELTDMEWVWPTSHIFVGNVQAGILEMGGVGRTIVWEGDSPGFFVTESYQEPRERTEVVRVRHHTDEKVVNENCGILIPTSAD